MLSIHSNTFSSFSRFHGLVTIEGDIIKTIRVAREQKCENKEPSHSFSCTLLFPRFWYFTFIVWTAYEILNYHDLSVWFCVHSPSHWIDRKLYNMILLPGQFRIPTFLIVPSKNKNSPLSPAWISSIKQGKMHNNGLLRLIVRGSAHTLHWIQFLVLHHRH